MRTCADVALRVVAVEVFFTVGRFPSWPRESHPARPRTTAHLGAIELLESRAAPPGTAPHRARSAAPRAGWAPARAGASAGAVRAGAALRSAPGAEPPGDRAGCGRERSPRARSSGRSPAAGEQVDGEAAEPVGPGVVGGRKRREPGRTVAERRRGEPWQARIAHRQVPGDPFQHPGAAQ